MGLLSNLFRMVVIIVNCLFMITGLAFFAGGLFLRFGDSVLDGVVDSAETSLESSLASAGFGTVDINLEWSSILLGLALVFTFVGLAVIIITIMGCCGACYKISCMLTIYIIVCSVLLVGQAVTVGIVYGSPKTIQDPMKTTLKDNIQSGYGGLNGTNLVSQAWNIVMQKVECCGVDSYADFTGATNWVIDYTSYASTTLMTPLACCKTLPATGSDFSCAASGTTSTDNYLNTGCFDKIWDKTVGNTTLAAAILGGVGAFQLLLIVFAIVILCSEKKAKENKIRPADKPASKQKQNTHVKRQNNPAILSRRR